MSVVQCSYCGDHDDSMRPIGTSESLTIFICSGCDDGESSGLADADAEASEDGGSLAARERCRSPSSSPDSSRPSLNV